MKPSAYRRDHSKSTWTRPTITPYENPGKVTTKTLEKLIRETYLIARDLAYTNHKLRQSMSAIDASAATIRNPRFTVETRTVKHHIEVDLAVGAIARVETRWTHTGKKTSKTNTVLADTEYWREKPILAMLGENKLPIIKPRKGETPKETLKAVKWLYTRYTKPLYRLRGIVEAYIATVFPENNAITEQKPVNASKTLLIKALKLNLLTITQHLDTALRQNYNTTLGEIIGKIFNQQKTKSGVNPHHALAQLVKHMAK